MQRFVNQSVLMRPYLSGADLMLIQKFMPTKKVWSNKSDYTKATISSFLAEKRKQGKEICSPRYYESQGYGGVLGIKYQEVTQIVNQGPDDWKKFL